MSTLTPTSDSTQILNVSTFQVGDKVTTFVTPFNGLAGTIIQINFGNESNQVRVSWGDGSTSVAQVTELRRL